MTILSSTINNYLPTKRKATPSGWISFNAPCCHHNGHSIDNRGRGGIKLNDHNEISYHCFNCGFKCYWHEGRTLTVKFKKFLEWLGIPNAEITAIALDLLKIKNTEFKSSLVNIPVFSNVDIPNHFIKIDLNTNNEVKNYLLKRNLKLSDTNYYFSNNNNFKNRLIIPFYYKNNITGWTARTIKNNKVKYLTNSQPGFIFGMDWQQHDREFAIVTEGPIDAIHIQGLSLLGSEISKQQLLLLQALKKEIIIVPDRDISGKKLMKMALDLGLSISMPDWDKEINDVSDAVKKYGRILTLYTIIKYREKNTLKNKLREKKWFL